MIHRDRSRNRYDSNQEEDRYGRNERRQQGRDNERSRVDAGRDWEEASREWSWRGGFGDGENAKMRRGRNYGGSDSGRLSAESQRLRYGQEGGYGGSQGYERERRRDSGGASMGYSRKSWDNEWEDDYRREGNYRGSRSSQDSGWQGTGSSPDYEYKGYSRDTPQQSQNNSHYSPEGNNLFESGENVNERNWPGYVQKAGYGNYSENADWGWRSGRQDQQRNWEDHSGRGPKNYKRSDDRIEEDINECLMRHPELDASEIEVKVSQGVITLSGTVDHRQAKYLAEDIAESVSGVREISNQIRVSRERRQSQQGPWEQSAQRPQQEQPGSSAPGQESHQGQRAQHRAKSTGN